MAKYACEPGQENVTKIFTDFIADSVHNTRLSWEHHDGKRKSVNSKWHESTQRLFALIRMQAGARVNLFFGVSPKSATRVTRIFYTTQKLKAILRARFLPEEIIKNDKGMTWVISLVVWLFSLSFLFVLCFSELYIVYDNIYMIIY